MSKYILGISGTQCTGKSFLSRHLEPHFNVDSSQLSRSAQKELGWDSLSRAQESEDNMWALQDSILDAMIQRDERINRSARLTVVERSPADLFAYTYMWMNRLHIDPLESTRFQVYHKRLVDVTELYRTIFVIFPHDSIPFVSESDRADEQSREFVSTQICNYLAGRTYSRNIATFIFQPNINDRVKAVLCSLSMESIQ